jgi:hypothetical protein
MTLAPMRTAILGSVVLLFCSAASAQRPLTEEETIAPLVMKQGCWGGIIRYIEEDRTFEVDDTVCSDGLFYHMEFNDRLQLTARRPVRYPLDVRELKRPFLSKYDARLAREADAAPMR